MSGGKTKALYGASRIKRRRARVTEAEMADRRQLLIEIVEDFTPMTVRQAFYQVTVRRSENGYDKVQEALRYRRRRGVIPYGWIADNTRWQCKPITYSNPIAVFKSAARLYRKDHGANADVYVEVWLEKDALAGVVMDVTDEYDVPLMVSRGYSSLSFLHEAAKPSTGSAGRPISTTSAISTGAARTRRTRSRKICGHSPIRSKSISPALR